MFMSELTSVRRYCLPSDLLVISEVLKQSLTCLNNFLGGSDIFKKIYSNVNKLQNDVTYDTCTDQFH